jgi:hypothetical protein
VRLRFAAGCLCALLHPVVLQAQPRRPRPVVERRLREQLDHSTKRIRTATQHNSPLYAVPPCRIAPVVRRAVLPSCVLASQFPSPSSRRTNIACQTEPPEVRAHGHSTTRLQLDYIDATQLLSRPTRSSRSFSFDRAASPLLASGFSVDRVGITKAAAISPRASLLCIRRFSTGVRVQNSVGSSSFRAPSQLCFSVASVRSSPFMQRRVCVPGFEHPMLTCSMLILCVRSRRVPSTFEPYAYSRHKSATMHHQQRVSLAVLLFVSLLTLSCFLTPTHGQVDSSSTGVPFLDDSSSSSTGPDGTTGVPAANGDASSSSTGDGFNSSSYTGPFVFSSSSTGAFNGTLNCTLAQINCTLSNLTSSSSSSGGFSSSSSSTAGNSDIPPGGQVGHGGSSFGSTDAIFLTTVLDVWIDIMLWTMVFTSFAFVGASVVAIRANKSIRYLWLWLPPVLAIFGAGVGFMHGTVSAALIAAASISIPYPVGIDIAAGLGIGQAICIVYFHLGRADFIHR